MVVTSAFWLSWCFVICLRFIRASSFIYRVNGAIDYLIGPYFLAVGGLDDFSGLRVDLCFRLYLRSSGFLWPVCGGSRLEKAAGFGVYRGVLSIGGLPMIATFVCNCYVSMRRGDILNV